MDPLQNELKDQFTPTFTGSRQEQRWIKDALGEFYAERWFTDVLYRVQGGKEATVYCCRAHPATGLDLIAAKVFRPRMFRAMKNDSLYKIGRLIKSASPAAGLMNSKGLAELAYDKGMHVLTAAQGYQAAWEVERLGHGLLSFALVREGLMSEAADSAPPDGRVMLREWLDYAVRRVPELQREELRRARLLGHDLAFTAEQEGSSAARPRNSQQPRLYYRRELEEERLVIAVAPAPNG